MFCLAKDVFDSIQNIVCGRKLYTKCLSNIVNKEIFAHFVLQNIEICTLIYRVFFGPFTRGGGQGFPQAVYTWGDLSPPIWGGQVQGDKALMGGGLMREYIDLMGGT